MENNEEAMYKVSLCILYSSLLHIIKAKILWPFSVYLLFI